MFDDEHGNGAAEQILDLTQRIAVAGKPRREVFNTLHELPELRKLILRKALIGIEHLPALEGKACDCLVRGDALKVFLILLLDRFPTSRS